MAAPPICLNPFSWCEVHHDGSLFSCCPAWIGRPLGNLLQDSFAALWNGPRARAIRAAILDGSFRHCNRRRCPHLAGSQPPVVPLSAVTAPRLRTALEQGETHLPFGPSRFNLCYDRSCNLACPSCRPAAAIARGPELERVRAIHQRLLPQLAASAEELRLCGSGEPFASPVLRPFLAGLQAGDFPSLRRIHLHSNGQLWTPAAWQELAAIHPLVKSAEISVDAGSATSYRRNRGGDWGQLQENLRFIARLGIELKLSCVVQANNFRELPAFVALACSLGAGAYLSQLVDWRALERTDYLSRAVHLPQHPQHRELCEVLATLGRGSDLDLGNLAPLAAPENSLQPGPGPC